jgi:hypothetical protein
MELAMWAASHLVRLIISQPRSCSRFGDAIKRSEPALHDPLRRNRRMNHAICTHAGLLPLRKVLLPS